MSAPLPDIVRFPLEQKHIDRGRISDCRHCPLALAIEDAFPDYIPSVGYAWADLLHRDQHDVMHRLLLSTDQAAPGYVLFGMVWAFDHPQSVLARPGGMQPGTLVANFVEHTITWEPSQ